MEINSPFSRIPDTKPTRGWFQWVWAHPAFRFTAMLWQRFTHEDQASTQGETAFRDTMTPLPEAGRLGAVLLQFPYRFHRTRENRAYLRRLANAFQQYPLVLEIRHRSWDRPEVYVFLQELGLGSCNIPSGTRSTCWNAVSGSCWRTARHPHLRASFSSIPSRLSGYGSIVGWGCLPAECDAHEWLNRHA
jgi:uncharacterized protein YecE (DUF72 family)